MLIRKKKRFFDDDTELQFQEMNSDVFLTIEGEFSIDGYHVGVADEDGAYCAENDYFLWMSNRVIIMDGSKWKVYTRRGKDLIFSEDESKNILDLRFDDYMQERHLLNAEKSSARALQSTCGKYSRIIAPNGFETWYVHKGNDLIRIDYPKVL